MFYTLLSDQFACAAGGGLVSTRTMDGNTQSTGAAQLTNTVLSPTFLSRASTWLVWTLFVLSLGALALTARTGTDWRFGGLFVVDGLTVIMWVVVAFLSGIVHSYSRRYMRGERYVGRFFLRILSFTLVVGVLVAADHVVLFATAWLAMGLVMASLIGHVRDWKQARAAGRMARRYFLASSGLIAAGLALLVLTTGATSITDIFGSTEAISPTVSYVAVGALVLAALIQSALFPFHGWLLSSMTAPTPASAVMHAGFVNAGGILLTRFAPLFADQLGVMSLIVAVGALSALLGQALLLVQPTIKRKLGASTLAQMGFMILQCGLGFFSAAVTHLIVHGFYKAFLFLSSGSAIEQTTPEETPHPRLGASGLAASLVAAVGGGVLFALLTGKGTALDSGLLLALVVSLTTLHAARDVLRQRALSLPVRLGGLPLIVFAAVGLYSALFTAISRTMATVPMADTVTELTVVHVAIMVVFVGSYVVTELGWHRDSNRLYVALLNMSTPAPSTVLTRKEDYHDT